MYFYGFYIELCFIYYYLLFMLSLFFMYYILSFYVVPIGL